MSLTKAVEKYINEIKDNLPSFQMDPGYILAELSSHDRTSSFTGEYKLTRPFIHF